jgi:DNA invertase Pin-like site-specific DNA recombinase
MTVPNEEPPVALAYSYIRFSHTGQIKGDSLRRQAHLSDEFAKKHNLRIARNYSDLGKSGFRGKNKTEGALGRFAKDVEDKKIPVGSVLLVESLDRISREKIGTALPWFINLLNSGIRIATITDGRIYDQASANDAMQLMGSLMIMVRANEESETKARRVRESWVGRRQKGIKGAVCPSWLKLNPATQS